MSVHPGETRTGPAPRRVDASMSLLSDITTNALDEDYLRMAVRRWGQPDQGRGGRLGLGLLAFAVAGLLLAVAGIQTREAAPVAARTRAALIERIQAQEAQLDRLERDVERLRRQADEAHRAALAESRTGRVFSANLKQLELAAAAVPVTGKGIKVVVDDAPAPADLTGEDTAVDSGRIRDTDLQLLINGLWAAGAEAIAINGQRLNGLTAIRSAGDAILVAYRPLSPPYSVEAIGEPEQLEVDFVDGPGGWFFRSLKENYGVKFNLFRKDEMSLPAASGVTLRQAEQTVKRKGTS